MGKIYKIDYLSLFFVKHLEGFDVFCLCYFIIKKTLINLKLQPILIVKHKCLIRNLPMGSNILCSNKLLILLTLKRITPLQQQLF